MSLSPEVRRRLPEKQPEFQWEEKQQPVHHSADDSLTAALDGIFSDAEKALSDSEREAQSKIIKFMYS